MSRLKSDQETHRDNSKAIISITEKLDILDNDLNEEIANIFINKVSPGSAQTSIIGAKIEISIAKPLTENLEHVQFESKMGKVKLPPASALGLPFGTSIGIKVILTEIIDLYSCILIFQNINTLDIILPHPSKSYL